MENEDNKIEVPASHGPVLDKLVDDYYKLKVAVLEFTTALEGYTELARQPTKTVLEAITQSDKFIEMKNLTL